MNKVFIEIGGGVAGYLSFLSLQDWRTRSEALKRLPEFFLNKDFQWNGYIVEPVPENFIKLMDSKKRNDFQDIEYIFGAISGRSSFQLMTSYEFTLDNECHPMSSLVEPVGIFFDENRKLKDIFYIKTFTLDELLDWVGITPTILRIDIEHSERDVFETFSWAHRP